MIDMRRYISHPNYHKKVEDFKASFSENGCDGNWSTFTELQQEISNNKCPVCEVELTNDPNKTNTATLDHFRPKAEKKYPHLKCDPENYILMCSLCNSTYKKDEFPLLDESKREKEAKKVADIKNEEPLLFNPTEKDPLDFFELAFRQTQQGGILELKRKPTIEKDSYQYKICETMIKTFGLGYCDTYSHPSDNVKMCRIDILTKHYTTFIEIAKAIDEKNEIAFALILRDQNRKNELEKYGFFSFLKKKQFVIK